MTTHGYLAPVDDNSKRYSIPKPSNQVPMMQQKIIRIELEQKQT